MTDPAAEEALFNALAWALPQRLSGLRDGAHAGRSRGAGGAFAGLAPLMAAPDARRLDLRRSLSDPFGGFYIRRFERPTDLTLHLMLDCSASLSAGARADKQGLAALLCGGLAQAAARGGDRAALQAIAGDQAALDEPASRRPGLGPLWREAVLGLRPSGHGITGLRDRLQALPARRLLIVLISDFELTPDELRALLTAAGERPLLAIWLRDSGLEQPEPRLGLTALRDPESGRRRVMLTHRAWARREAGAAAERRAELRALFQSFGRRPIEVTDSIAAEALIEAFAEVRL